MADNFQVKDASGSTITKASKDLGTGVQADKQVITDFSGNMAAVKAASTPAVATDPALVVAISPNSQNLNGRAAEGSSTPVMLSNEDKAFIGIQTETAPTSDTASSGLNGRLQRIAQNIATQTGKLPTALGANGGLKIEGVASGTVVPVSLASVPSHAVTNAGAFVVQPNPTATANGFTSSRVNSGASTNATSLKASAGNIGRIDVFNMAAYDVFVKFFNKASAPTVGTDTPVWTIPLKAGTGYSGTFPFGKTFATGIAYAITKLQADTDTTAVAAGDVTGSIDWV